GAMTDGYLAAMRELWTSPDPSFAGAYTQFRELKFAPKPVQKPHPPIWVGGDSRPALRRAAEVGAAWHPINRSPAQLRAGAAEIARLCQARARTTPPTLSPRHDVCVLGPGQPARPSARPGHALVGEPAVVIDRLRELADCGAEHVVLEFLAADGRELDAQLVAFAERVRPALA